MQLVYIAGPYRGKTPHAILENIREAERVAICVWQAGGYALCPHMNSAFFDGLVPDEQFLAGTMEILKRCDAVVLITGWQQSSGSKKEVQYCLANGIPVYSSAHNWKHNNAMSIELLQELLDIWK